MTPNTPWSKSTTRAPRRTLGFPGPQDALEVRREPSADAVHGVDSRRDRLAGGLGRLQPSRVARGAAPVPRGGLRGRRRRDAAANQGLRDDDRAGAGLGLHEVLDLLRDLGVVRARRRRARRLERRQSVVVVALVLEGHPAAEVRLLPVGAELHAHVRVRERLLTWGRRGVLERSAARGRRSRRGADGARTPTRARSIESAPCSA